MSMSKMTYSELDTALRKFFSSERVEDTCNLLTDRVLDSSNLQSDIYVPNGVRFRATKLKQKVVLGLLQYYVDDALRVLINLWLEENWGAELPELKHCLLTSKELALGAILVQEKWSSRDFFGNVLTKENINFFFRTEVRKRPTHGPKRAVRRRGYQDKGSMRLPHESEPIYDWNDFLSVVEFENRRLSQRLQVDQFVERTLRKLAEFGMTA